MMHMKTKRSPKQLKNTFVQINLRNLADGGQPDKVLASRRKGYGRESANRWLTSQLGSLLLVEDHFLENEVQCYFINK